MEKKEPLLMTDYETYTKIFDALSHPMRIKIVGILAKERQYVSELARMLNISRPLLYMHLKKLEAAELVIGHHEVSESGKATKYYELIPFQIQISPEMLSHLAESIPINDMIRE